jgi:RNA polymerase sigma factor (TIGR02999 family)
VNASEELFSTLYRELHAIAERELRRRGSHLTLGTTTLLHEAYLNIARGDRAEFASRAHFLAYAARAMRGLIIDYARRGQATKRGGEFHITSSGLDAAVSGGALSVEELSALGSALDALGAVDPRLAELVDLHFFCGFSFREVAAFRGVSERTIQRDWRKARLLLHRALAS